MKIIQHSLPNQQKIARYFAKIALQALYDEISLFPKPGLVSFVDSGAHKDMDGALFYRSLCALRHYFFQIGLHAALGCQPSTLVALGIKAEKTMNIATKGVNTHKGAIFSLGIFCASICHLSSQKNHFTTEELQQHIITFWAEYLTYEHVLPTSHGHLVRQKYAVTDAKQLASQGYPLVFEIFHELDKLSLQNKTIFGLKAYHLLLNQLDDINVLYRTGQEGLDFAREQLNIYFKNQEDAQLMPQALRLHHVFSAKNISPGGVADMLGLIYFLQRLCEQTQA